MADGPKWQVQLGPTISGSGEGVINASAANFFVSGPSEGSFVSYSVTAGSTWVPIPPNTWVRASGSNTPQYRWAVPPGVEIKFLISVE